MKGACNLIPKGSRAKTFKANKELYDSTCEYCKKYGKGKTVPVCQVEKWDANSGQYKTIRKAGCRKKMVIKKENTVAHLRKEVKREGGHVTKDGHYKSKAQLRAYLERKHKKPLTY